MRNYSQNDSGRGRNNGNSRSYSYPQRHSREWDTLDNPNSDTSYQAGGSYDRRNTYGASTSDYQNYNGNNNRGYNSRYGSREWDSYDGRDNGRYNERGPGSHYESRQNYGGRNQYNNNDDRNFFERAGDRIRQKWNDWTDNDRSYNDYENRQSYGSNFNDRDDYNNSYDRYNSGRSYGGNNNDRDYNYGSTGNHRGSNNYSNERNSGYGNNSGYGRYNSSERFDRDREYGYGDNTRAYNGNRGSQGNNYRSTEDFAW